MPNEADQTGRQNGQLDNDAPRVWIVSELILKLVNDAFGCRFVLEEEGYHELTVSPFEPRHTLGVPSCYRKEPKYSEDRGLSKQPQRCPGRRARHTLPARRALFFQGSVPRPGAGPGGWKCRDSARPRESYASRARKGRPLRSLLEISGALDVGIRWV